MMVVVCRLSPFVSGVVYLAYAAFIAYLIPKSHNELNAAADSSFPESWTHDNAGKAGLCIFGIAFLAGALTDPCTEHRCSLSLILLAT